MLCSLRFHSLIWVTFGMGEDDSCGRLIGGGENGTVTVYSPAAVLSGAADAVTGQSNKHTGPVRALDYNPFQVEQPHQRLHTEHLPRAVPSVSKG